MNACCENLQKCESPANVERVRSGPTYRPAVDIIENEHELLVVADVPGASSDDINIQFERGELTICAKVQPRRKDDVSYLLREYGVGDFCRTFRIGEGIDDARITAETKNGVLTLHLPKRESAKPRRIAVTSE